MVKRTDLRRFKHDGNFPAKVAGKGPAIFVCPEGKNPDNLSLAAEVNKCSDILIVSLNAMQMGACPIRCVLAGAPVQLLLS